MRIKTLGLSVLALALAGVLAIGCQFNYANPADSKGTNYEGISTVATSADIMAEKEFVSSSDGSAVPVFVCSRVIGATAYGVQVSSAADFSGTPLFDKSDAMTNEVPASGVLSSLSDGMTYYWRGRAMVGSWGPWSPTKTFTMKKVTGVTIGAALRGNPGTNASMPCTVSPSGATCGSLVWTSSDPSAIGVDSRGTLSFISAGSIAVITATSVDGGFSSSQVASVLLSSSDPTIIAGSSNNGSADGIGNNAQFSGATSICLFGGMLYITETSNNDIRSIDTTTFQVTRIAGNPATSGSADGDGINALFSSPQGICTDGTYLYVADTNNNTIRQITIAAPHTVTTLAGTRLPNTETDGIGTAATFFQVNALCTDGMNIYALESQSIRKIVIQTKQVITLYKASASASGDYKSICTDGESLYFSEEGVSNNNIYSLNLSSGVVSTVTEQSSSTNGSVDGIGPNAYFSGPKGLCTDGRSLYVSDSDSGWSYSSIRIVDLATKNVGTIASWPVDWTGAFATLSLCTDGSSLYYPMNITIGALPLH